MPKEVYPKPEHDPFTDGSIPKSFPEVSYGQVVELHKRVSADILSKKAQVGATSVHNAILASKCQFERFKEKGKKQTVIMHLLPGAYEIYVQNPTSKGGQFKGTFGAAFLFLGARVLVF